MLTEVRRGAALCYPRTVMSAPSSRASSPSRAGRITAWLLGPHVFLGGWLWVVPDHRAFLTNQVITLLHAGLALLTLPPVALYLVRHGARMVAPPARRSAWAFVVRWLLAAAVVVASATGLVSLYTGTISDPARLHAWAGLAVGVPLLLHLAASRHLLGAGAVALALVLSTGGGLLARRLLPPRALEAETPAFSFRTRPTELYEPSAWCGECHTTDYDEWIRSSHARTLDRKAVKASWVRMKQSTGFDLAAIGRVVGGEKIPGAENAIFSCEACHAPTSYYGDDPTPVMESRRVTDEGVSCSFCHTLRAINPGADSIKEARTDLRLNGTADYPKLLAQLPQWVSAPETVRRYLGQGSGSPALRQIGNWLIRWRPSVHAADYGSPLLGTARACLGCHSMGGLDEPPEVPHKTWISWKQSAYNTGDPATTVTCQDCHMVKLKNLTGRRVTNEKYRLVPWGPERGPGRNHLLLGGDVAAGEELGDNGYMRMEHKMNLRAARLGVLGSRLAGDEVHVDVRVENLMVGHYIPSMETHVRYLWVVVRALDAQGGVIAETPRPRSEDDFDGPSPLIFRCTEQPKPECDTLIRPNSHRDFVARLKLPPGSRPARLEARLHMSMDFLGPIATAQAPFAPRSDTP